MTENAHENGDAQAIASVGSTTGWVVSFLLFPFGPFVYLAWLKVITVRFSVLLLFVSAAVHFGVGSVLAETNREPWQPWLVYLLGGATYLVGMLQFVVGDRKGIWGSRALRYWRSAGWLFGALLTVGVLVQVAVFHLTKAGLIPR